MRHYLDHNAATPVDPRVLERFLEVEAACPANPSSAHAAGRRAAAALEQARSTIAQLLAVDDDEVVFVSGGTEANNFAVLGLGQPELGVAASVSEHPSVLEPARLRGLVELGVDPTGRIRWSAETDTHPAVVCAVHGQSELGVLNDLAAARAFADRHHAVLHVDASQTLGRVDLRPALAACDCLTLSVHKAGGLKGIGVLVLRARAGTLRPLLRGGGQERGWRAGTPSPALAAAAARTIELACYEQTERAVKMARARETFFTALASEVAVTRLTPIEQSLPNTLMLEFAAVADGRALLPAFDLAGVEASHGSACASGSPQPPRVLLAMGLSELRARRCVRFSFDWRSEPTALAHAARLVAHAASKLARS